MPQCEARADQNDYAHAEQWLDQLSGLDQEAPLADWVPQESFALSAYRLSLLGLIGDAGAENRQGVSASLAQLPMQWRVEPVFETVQRAGVAYMSRGQLLPHPMQAPARAPAARGQDKQDKQDKPKKRKTQTA